MFLLVGKKEVVLKLFYFGESVLGLVAGVCYPWDITFSASGFKYIQSKHLYNFFKIHCKLLAVKITLGEILILFKNCIQLKVLVIHSCQKCDFYWKAEPWEADNVQNQNASFRPIWVTDSRIADLSVQKGKIFLDVGSEQSYQLEVHQIAHKREMHIGIWEIKTDWFIHSIFSSTSGICSGTGWAFSFRWVRNNHRSRMCNVPLAEVKSCCWLGEIRCLIQRSIICYCPPSI